MAYRALRIARGDSTALRDSRRTTTPRPASSTPVRWRISSTSSRPCARRRSRCSRVCRPRRSIAAAQRTTTRCRCGAARLHHSRSRAAPPQRPDREVRLSRERESGDHAPATFGSRDRHGDRSGFVHRSARDHDRTRPSQGVRHSQGARLLHRHPRLRGGGADGRSRGVHLGGRLPSPHRSPTPGISSGGSRHRLRPPGSITSRSATRPAAIWRVALKRVIDSGVTLQGASDHGVSQAIYLADPDQNGIELYWDRPQASGEPRNERGEYALVSDPLDLEELLAEAS